MSTIPSNNNSNNFLFSNMQNALASLDSSGFLASPGISSSSTDHTPLAQESCYGNNLLSSYFEEDLNSQSVSSTSANYSPSLLQSENVKATEEFDEIFQQIEQILDSESPVDSAEPKLFNRKKLRILNPKKANIMTSGLFQQLCLPDRVIKEKTATAAFRLSPYQSQSLSQLPYEPRYSLICPNLSISQNAKPKINYKKIKHVDRYITRSRTTREKEIAQMKFNNIFPCSSIPHNELLLRSATGLDSEGLSKFPLMSYVKTKENIEPGLLNILTHPTITLGVSLTLPNMAHDFYSNVLDLSKNNQIAIGLDNRVYISNSISPQYEVQACFNGPKVSSVCWLDQGERLAIGTEGGMEIVNISRRGTSIDRMIGMPDNSFKTIRTIVQLNKDMLAVGADSNIMLVDLSEENEANPIIANLRVHTDDICKLSLSCDRQYLASGGNDDQVKVWNTSLSSDSRPLFSFSHKGAVRALAWNPLKTHLLASGGGAADKTIKLHDTARGIMLCNIETESAVTNLHWLDERYLISTDGLINTQQGLIHLWYLSKNHGQYKFKEIPLMINQEDFHTNRILYTALSADKKLLLTAGQDEVLKKWNIEMPMRTKQRPSSLRTKSKSIFSSTIR